MRGKFQFELPSWRLLPKFVLPRFVLPKLWKLPRKVLRQRVLPQINMPRILIFITLVPLLAYASYNNGYVSGYEDAYSLGYKYGYSLGYSQDKGEFERGYSLGYDYGCSQAEAKYIEGYNLGYKLAREEIAVRSQSVGLGNEVVLKNPTFEELRDFIIKDPTNRNKFILNQYECRHFATELDNNAEAAGLRCAFVLLCYDKGQHAVIAFETTDRGLVYIEPQTDAVIHPEVGDNYQEKDIKEILITW